MGEGKQTWTLLASLLWPPFGIFESVTESGAGCKKTCIPCQAKSAAAPSQGRWVAAGPGKAIKRDGKWAIRSSAAEQRVFALLPIWLQALESFLLVLR